MTHKTTATTKDWDINDSQFPKLQVYTNLRRKINKHPKFHFVVKESGKQPYELLQISCIS